MGYFTIEDARASFNLFCCVYGIGTLGMPLNYAKSGPFYATLALILMAFINVYSSVVVSKCMLIVPSYVNTLGDLGEHCFGKVGRYMTVIAQMGVCITIPIAFLVLGSSLLLVLFPESLGPYEWIVLMAICILPVALTPTLKESSAAAFAGCLGTILADFISLGVIIYYLSDQPGTKSGPEISFESVVSCFGNLSLAYGAAIIIPTIQREHSDPTHMPRVVCLTLVFTSCLFLSIAVTGYIYIGCQIPGNLLFAISGSELGFTANRGAVVLAFLCMQLHITIAFSVILHPAFYIAERMLFRMHQSIELLHDSENPTIIMESHNQKKDLKDCSRNIQLTNDIQVAIRYSIVAAESKKTMELNYLKRKQFIKCIIFRVLMIISMVVIACLLKDHFMAFSDLIGASAVSLSCIILPIAFYMKLFWKSLRLYEKVLDSFIVLFCTFLALYLSYVFGKELFKTSTVTFPYCPVKYQYIVYTNISHYSN